MKRLLLNSTLVCLWSFFVFFSCSDGNSRAGATNGSDTSGKNISGKGAATGSNESNTVNPGRDTTLQYKTEVRNNGSDQAKIDSIKNAKTRKKK